MAVVKNSNELRVEVRWYRGTLVPRVFRGEAEIQIREMTQGIDGLDFSADLGTELETPIAPVPADEAAAALLSAADKVAIHKAAEEAEKARLSAQTPAEPALESITNTGGKAKAGKG